MASKITRSRDVVFNEHVFPGLQTESSSSNEFIKIDLFDNGINLHKPKVINSTVIAQHLIVSAQSSSSGAPVYTPNASLPPLFLTKPIPNCSLPLAHIVKLSLAPTQPYGNDSLPTVVPTQPSQEVMHP